MAFTDLNGKAHSEDDLNKYIEAFRHKEKNKPFMNARGHVQRVVDVTLIVTNAAHLSRVMDNKADYTSPEFNALISLLVISIILQVIGAVCFFIVLEKKEWYKKSGEKYQKHGFDYTAIACVGSVMLLNIIIVSFDSTWSKRDQIIPGVNYIISANGTVTRLDTLPTA